VESTLARWLSKAISAIWPGLAASAGGIDLSDLICARLPLPEANAAFGMAEDRNHLKFVLFP